MRKKITAAVLPLALIATPVILGTSACTCGPSAGASAIYAQSGSDACSSGGGNNPAPQPTNKWVADCTADLEGPDNQPVGSMTTYIDFSCVDAVYNVVLALNVYRSTNPAGPIGTRSNLVASKTCDSISSACQIVVPCTEGRWLAGYTIAGTIDGTYETYSDLGNTNTYSAGDCQV